MHSFMPISETHSTNAEAKDFIREIIANDLASGRCKSVHTRFPPEPNGMLHIGHAKSICLNFGLARDFGGVCNLRMDDTNPVKEESAFVAAIMQDVRWLIEGWADACLGLSTAAAKPAREGVDFHLAPAVVGSAFTDAAPFHASAYFEALYFFAERLVEKGLAFVCDLTPEETDAYRGAPDKPGRPSPYRDRTVEENLDLLRRMKAGEFPDGSRTLRAKIDMASPNVWLRDPVLYRIRHTAHHQTGHEWCIYPLYDFAHCLSDYIEGITHSVCTLEFDVHRPLYDWLLESLDLPRPLPHQYEFSRLNLSYTVMSKRKLIALVRDGHVSGWDDPRLPTLCGLRRRGVTAEIVRDFVTSLGVTKYKGTTDIAVLEHAIRTNLNAVALRRMAVLDPIRVVITNLPEGHMEEVVAVNNPEDESEGTRMLPFSNRLLIDAQDFMEVPEKKFHRLAPGTEVRLKYAYIIRCDEVVKNPDGTIAELRCTADLDSRSGGARASRRVKGTIHWVSAPHAIPAEIRLYDRLFTVENPDEAGNFLDYLNPQSLAFVMAQCEPSLAEADPLRRYQLERLCYIALDPDSRPGRPIFNRIISLRDSWQKATRG